RTGYRIETAHGQLVHSEYDFIRGDLDRYAIDRNRPRRGIVEIKTTSTFAQRYWPDDRLALPYLWQGTHYHNVDPSCDWGMFCILILPPEVRSTIMLILHKQFNADLLSDPAQAYFRDLVTPIIERYAPSLVYTTRGEQQDAQEIPIDDELCGLLLDREVQFYRDHVETGIAPDPTDGTDDYKLLYPEEVSGKCLTAGGPLAGQIAELEATREMQKELKETEENLKRMLGIVLRDNERVIGENHETLLYYRKTRSGNRIFSFPKNKKENPQ
ncbi:MAG: YqaJ viral recombinase family protein, partial [Planctomycetota bacterium]